MATKKSDLEADGRYLSLGSAALRVGPVLPRLLKSEVALTKPTKLDVEAGVRLLASTAKTTNVDADLFNAIVEEVAEAMQNRESNEIGLTEHEAQLLIESGDFTQEEFDEVAQFITDGGLAKLERTSYMQSLLNTYTSAEAASLLDRDPSSLRPRKGVSRFYSFAAGTKRLYPKWQFVADGNAARVLPNLAAVIAAIPPGWGPADVEGFMTTPQEDLEASAESDVSLTPVEWLAAAKDPNAVVDILAEADMT
ncbi:hypothetical protein OVA26_16835 [Microbacterium sp. SL62]|uniref:hypothetical protein n=1 Tax=Microbacterium sp. SL62 TaxID=2995139 RepID=UPI002272B6D1|nr:hypothetical protein [Microbacterium sp. SL62]MCY1718605.1 hypothetical protein [Microbacterium sp. SL62]